MVRHQPRSFGLIIAHVGEAGVEFLIQQRRDTFEYMDFVRGAWKHPNQLPSLFSEMSSDERERISENAFRLLWKDLFLGEGRGESYERAKRKFEGAEKAIEELLADPAPESGSLPWGFPKGKKDRPSESEVDCALREAEEEAVISRKLLRVLQVSPLEETFVGSNSKAYSTSYFVAVASEKPKEQASATFGILRGNTISEEANATKWVSAKDSLQYLGERRADMLRVAEEEVLGSVLCKRGSTPSFPQQEPAPSPLPETSG